MEQIVKPSSLRSIKPHFLNWDKTIPTTRLKNFTTIDCLHHLSYLETSIISPSLQLEYARLPLTLKSKFALIQIRWFQKSFPNNLLFRNRRLTFRKSNAFACYTLILHTDLWNDWLLIRHAIREQVEIVEELSD